MSVECLLSIGGQFILCSIVKLIRKRKGPKGNIRAPAKRLSCIQILIDTFIMTEHSQIGFSYFTLPSFFATMFESLYFFKKSRLITTRNRFK